DWREVEMPHDMRAAQASEENMDAGPVYDDIYVSNSPLKIDGVLKCCYYRHERFPASKKI
ncbi:hypothetical protein AVEN_52732-1, partial [Araneus ventricosus]